MASKAWIKKNFGEHQYPSIISGILSLVGSTIGNQWNNMWAWWGGMGGLVAGYFIGASLQPEVLRNLSSKQMARKKMIQDFANSALRNRVNYERIIDDLDERVTILKKNDKVLRMTSLTKGEEDLNLFPTNRNIHAKNSNRTQVQALVADAESLKQNLKRPIIVNCSGIALGVIAVLVSLKKNYGIPIHIDKADAYGVSQIKTVASNNKDVDFLITPESPFLLASGNRLDDYYRLFPIFSEQQRVLRRNGGTTKWMEVIFLKRSAAEEQAIIGFDIPANSKPVGIDLLDELEERIEAMRKGDSAIVWEPVATLFGNKPGFYLEKGIYLNWFVCYCQERWLSGDFSIHRNSFVKLFADEWRYCEHNIDETWKLLYEEETLFIESFKEKTLSR